MSTTPNDCSPLARLKTCVDLLAASGHAGTAADWARKLDAADGKADGTIHVAAAEALINSLQAPRANQNTTAGAYACAIYDAQQVLNDCAGSQPVPRGMRLDSDKAGSLKWPSIVSTADVLK